MDCARYRVVHETHYSYAAPVLLSQQLAHLRPRSCPWQQCEAHHLSFSPPTSEWRERVDYFGNAEVAVTIETPHDELVVRAESRVKVLRHAIDIGRTASPAWESLGALLHAPPDEATLDACRYLFESPHIQTIPALARLTRPAFLPRRPALEATHALCRAIHRGFQFDPHATTIATPLDEVIAKRRGVCQDFAHLAIACLRSLGLAARYVSGYILTVPPPGSPRLVGADASHAWLSVFVPGMGWVDFDPTNDLLPDLQHVTLAWGRDFSDISPLRGVILGGAEQEIDVRVTVEPTEPAPPWAKDPGHATPRPRES
jgi:transglutaminase-like putative cysteine protease